MGRTFAIGDVHGCDTALGTLLARISLQAEDTVVFLGDLIDRGSGSKQVIDQVLETKQRCRVITIKGNHEAMLLHALRTGDEVPWMEFGGDAALKSYDCDIDEFPSSHIEFYQSMVDYWETHTAIFIHANLEHGVPLAEQPSASLRWQSLEGDEPRYDAQRRVICGHTPQKNGYPLVFPGWVCIDTDCQRGGWLTALDVGADWVFQANKRGETRDFVLGGMA